MPPRIKIQHLHLPGLTHYAHASSLQAILVSSFLAFKRGPLSPASLPFPQPTIITFTPYPIYTAGRRETDAPSAEQLALLRAPLPPLLPRSLGPNLVTESQAETVQTAEFTHALRGGQTTFHGPGQLVIYPIISLAQPSSFARGRLSPRCYVNTLEEATIRTLARYGVCGMRTENPGVWVVGLPSERRAQLDSKWDADKGAGEERKIAALGVHLRRNVASHGVGLNISTDLRWFDRIVACGLEGKGVTSLEKEIASSSPASSPPSIPSLETVADSWVVNFARLMEGEEGGEIVKISEANLTAQDMGCVM